MAARLGLELMPWQQHVLDVALELDPDTGRLWYSDITLLVPRQSGKTTLLLPLKVHRALGFGDRQVISFGAQTRKDARQKWTEEHIPILQAAQRRSPSTFDFSLRLANGDEHLRWANGSREVLQANTEQSGHGATLDLHCQDEAFSLVDFRIDQAAKPAMVTRPEPQFWRVSTAGKSPARSPYLYSFVVDGRARPDGRRSAYFEWSADPDIDPHDKKARASYMPAYDLTQSEAAVDGMLDSLPIEEFERAFMNRWGSDATSDADAVIPSGDWDDRIDPEAEPGRPLWFAVDVAPSGAAASIAACGPWREGCAVEIVDHRPGTGWLARRLEDLVRKHRPAGTCVDWAGPAQIVRTELEAAAWLEPVPSMSAACGRFQGSVSGPEARLFHRDQYELRDALHGAAKSDRGDGWIWKRRTSAGDISPLVAATLAVDAWERGGDEAETCDVY